VYSVVYAGVRVLVSVRDICNNGDRGIYSIGVTARVCVFG